MGSCKPPDPPALAKLKEIYGISAYDPDGNKEVLERVLKIALMAAEESDKPEPTHH